MTKTTQSAPIKALINDPFRTYKALAKRIRKQGPLAPMPEFEPAVRFLQQELVKPDIIEYCNKNSFAEAERQMALNGLWHVDLAFEVSPDTGGTHQHKPPVEGRFPYIPTLQVIDAAVAFFDAHERATKQGHDFHYHVDRYRYHALSIPLIGDWIDIPTADAMGLKDLIAARAVPEGAVMVTSKTQYIDAYFNSPMNAKVHDGNHNRRFNSENERYFKREHIKTRKGRMKAYKKFNKTIQNVILPSIALTPDMSDHERNVRKAMTALYFEFLHEYAKTPDRKTLIEELMFKPDAPSAFEVVLREGDTPANIEERRLQNKNLESGMIYTHGKPENTVYYFMDKGRNFLTSSYNKNIHGFFDNCMDNSAEAPSGKGKDVEYFVEAVHRIMHDFRISADEICMPESKIRALLKNEEVDGIQGKNLETYPADDPDNILNREPKEVVNHRQSDTHRQRVRLG